MSEEKTTQEYVDLVMENGELARICCQSQHYDEFMDSIENTMKRKDWWSPSQFDGCTAEYMGMRLGRVNMGKVVGML